jgi:chemotaxis protein methyltransferase CheR
MQHVQFQNINLMRPLPQLPRFDVVFLRNVLIYFDGQTKQKVVRRVMDSLKPGGYLFTSHVESLHGVCDDLMMIKPSVFVKPDRKN